jgi:SAM-dependent methyltransferase
MRGRSGAEEREPSNPAVRHFALRLAIGNRKSKTNEADLAEMKRLVPLHVWALPVAVLKPVAPFTSQQPSAVLNDQQADLSQLSRRDATAATATAAATALSFLLAPAEVASAAAASEEPAECRNGAIVGESQISGAYQQICMELSVRSIPLQSTAETVIVAQGTTDGSTRTVQGRTGVAVWNSALLLTRLLDRISAQEMKASVPQDISLIRSKNVLELGCGCGLSSIAAAKLGAARVIATDGNAEVVQLANYNVEKNGVGNIVETAELKWGLLNAVDYYDEADIILGSDLTYNSGSWKVLAETMGAVLRPNGFVVYLSLGHSGFNVSGELTGFLSVLESEGLEVIEETNSRWPLKEVVSSMPQLLASCVNPFEKAVLEANGGARVVVLGRKQRR